MNARPIPTHFTAQQRAFIQAVRDSRKPLFLRATAGAGKTTTIKEAAWHVPPTEKAAYFVYNRTAREEVGSGLPPYVPAKTIHADGAGELARTGLNTNIQQGKSIKLAELIFPSFERVQQSFLARLWDKAREFYLHENSEGAELLRLFTNAGGAMPEDPQKIPGLAEFLRGVMSEFSDESLRDWEMGNGPDFTDQLWLPIRLGLGEAKYRTLFVDEAQDLSPLRQAYILHVTGHLYAADSPGRLILVGELD